MYDWIVSERLPCVAFTLTGALLLALRLRERTARIAWLVLLAASVLYAIVLTAMSANLTNNNIVHYYLGAKYDVPYSQFYRVTYAAASRPQVAMHDLDRPPSYVRGDSTEQRAYYIDLLRSTGQSFDPLAATPSLRQEAISAGAVAREADSILLANLDPTQIERFKDDVRRALEVEREEANTAQEQSQLGDDYGFNGSPFYAALRHLDPTLHRPFDRWVGTVNLAWQIPSVIAGFWLLGAALGLGTTQRLATLALLFASWDLAGWSLPGLILGGLWLPIGLASWLASRGRPKLAGGTLAWAGVIKLFPFGMLIPSLVGIARGVLLNITRRERATYLRTHLSLVGSCFLWAAILTLASLAFGRSWTDYLAKVAVQFGSQAYLLNSVSFNQLLLTLGVFDTPVLSILRLLLAGILGVLLWVAPEPDLPFAHAKRAIVVLALCGFFVDTWFNYYALAPVVLLVCASRTRPLGAAIGVTAFALATLLPEWDHPILRDQPALWSLKIAPYLAVPCWLAWLELAPAKSAPGLKRALWALAALALALAAGEVARKALVRHYEVEGNRALDQGDAKRASLLFDRQLTFSPHNDVAEMNRGISFAMLGRAQDAVASFDRAVRLAPANVRARVNYAHMLLKLGHYDKASAQVEAALEYSPSSVDALLEYGRIRLAQERPEEARESLRRALELQPTNRMALHLLQSLP